MTAKMKRRLRSICLGALLLVAAIVLEKFNIVKSTNGRLIFYLAAYLAAGGDVIKKAFRNLANGAFLDENFLMVIASLGAFLINEKNEAVGVMLFYQVGELFQDYAVNRSRRSIADLMDIKPETANVIREGKTETVSPEEVKAGEIIVIKPGERIPLDSVVESGTSSLNTVAITGEAMPEEVKEGDTLISGCVNLNGLLKARVTKEYADSTVARILELVEGAAERKANTESFITRFARYYTPAVVVCALLLFIVPSLIFKEPKVWGYRALSFLVISCPCALVISVPLSFFGGIGAASSKGILIKGSNYLEAFARARTVIFDKTGTLTKGVFKLSHIHPSEEAIKEKGGDRDSAERMLLSTAALCEGFSTHPIACSIVEAAAERGLKDPEGCNSTDTGTYTDAQVEEKAGRGVIYKSGNKRIICGNAGFLKDSGIENIPGSPGSPDENFGTAVYTALDGRFLGTLYIADEVRSDSGDCIKDLKKLGIRPVMLTGDNERSACAVGKKLGIEDIYSGLLPEDKVLVAEKIIEEEQRDNKEKKVVFVGDGINDAPVLARADIGVAMGGAGSDAAIEAADIVLMTDEPSKLITALAISRKTLMIVRENIVFAIGVKLITLVLAALGIASMWAAVFADVGVAVIAILNAMRAMHVKVQV